MTLLTVNAHFHKAIDIFKTIPSTIIIPIKPIKNAAKRPRQHAVKYLVQYAVQYSIKCLVKYWVQY